MLIYGAIQPKKIKLYALYTLLILQIISTNTTQIQNVLLVYKNLKNNIYR